MSDDSDYTLHEGHLVNFFERPGDHDGSILSQNVSLVPKG